MTWSELAQLLTALAVVATFVRGWAADRRANRKLDDADRKLDELHRTTNGMKTELVDEVRKASFAAGVKAQAEGEANPTK